MRCLVTGATGFIGGAVARCLCDAGHDVVTYVRSTRNASRFSGLECIDGSLGDPNRIAFAATGCQALVHAAGIADPRVGRHRLGWTHRAGTENVICAAKQARCQQLIYISCADVTLHHGPRSFWKEDDAPIEPYGELFQSKLYAEELVRVSGKGWFCTTILRPALVWGPGESEALRAWQREAKTGGIRIIGRGEKLFATTFVDNLAHAVLCALGATVPSGQVYYVIDPDLSVSSGFFAELSEALGWEAPRSAGPLWWAWPASRLGLSCLHPTQVLRRGHSSTFEAERAKRDLRYQPPHQP